MSYTTADLDSIKEAYATGITRSTVNGRTIEFRSREEMAGIISDIENELNGGVKTDQQKAYFPTFDRGYR